MNSETAHIPGARSWRDIPQPVKPRAMSRGGRLRLILAAVRTTAFVLLLLALAWGVWSVVAALRQGPSLFPALKKSPPMGAPQLVTTRGGVLDNAWLERTLELPPGATLLDVDVERLRARVLADQQVQTAHVTKRFAPDRLVVQIIERSPVARVRLQHGSSQHDLLVARDGVVFSGTNFDPAMLATLPWLDGIALTPEGVGYQPIASMNVVARLLADAQFYAPHLYQTWQKVSLARLDDGEIEVTTKQGSIAVFNAKSEFFMQFAYLDYVVDKLSAMRSSTARIDLTLGRAVPVRLLTPASAPAPAARKEPAVVDFSSFLSQPKTHREL